MAKLSALLGGLLALSAAPLAQALPAIDPPAAPSIVSVTYSGSGCPQGSNNEVFGDEDSLNFAFHNFGANFGAEGGRTTNCEVHLNLDGGGAGWALSLETVNVKGRLVTPADSQIAFFTTAFWSQTASATITKERRIEGANDRDINIRQQLASPSPCGSVGILNINFRAALTSGSAGSFTGSANAPVTEELTFAWRRC